MQQHNQNSSNEQNEKNAESSAADAAQQESVFKDLSVPTIFTNDKVAESNMARLPQAAGPTADTSTSIAKDDPGVELPIGGWYSRIQSRSLFSRIASTIKHLAQTAKYAVLHFANKVLGLLVTTSDGGDVFKIPLPLKDLQASIRPTAHVVSMLGEGGEAKIYRAKINGELKGLKVFRSSDDSIYKTEASRQVAARRISEYAERLAEFPKISSRVIAPQSITYNRNGKLVGYTMDLIQNSFPLTKLLTPDGCQKLGMSRNEVIEIFLDLHDTLKELHSKGIIIGDFRPENVLITSSAVYIVDAESMQFGRWKCHNFTPGWVDPLLCELGSDGKTITRPRPHHAGGDWYAFSVMLFQALTGCPPYGGTIIERGRIVPENERPFKRLSVFSKDSILPHFSLPLESLSRDLLDVFRATFGRDDLRAEFPRELLEETIWHECTSCQQEYCGQSCPGCGQKLPRDNTKLQALRLNPAEISLPPGHQLLALQEQASKLRYLTFDPISSCVVRQDGTQVGQLSAADAYEDYLILGSNTALLKHGTCCVLTESGENLRIPLLDPGLLKNSAVAGNDHWLFFVKDHQLLRLNCDQLDVSAPQVQVQNLDLSDRRVAMWYGTRKGLLLADDEDHQLDLYVFDGASERQVENVPEIHGHIIAAQACFSKQTAWLTLHTREHARELRYLIAIDLDSRKVRAWTKGSELKPPAWLEQVGSKAAYEDATGSYLMAATSAGLFRLKIIGERLVPTGAAHDLLIPSNVHLIFDHDELKLVKESAAVVVPRDMQASTESEGAGAKSQHDNILNSSFDFSADAFLNSIHNKITSENEQANHA